MEARGGNDHSHVAKRKRTKRQRLSIPIFATAAMTSSSSGCGEADDYDQNLSSPTSSFEVSGCTEEDADMANCLMLLAQGGVAEYGQKLFGEERQEMRLEARSDGKAGFDVYECKTCKRCFPSFQALGGHRASHKRPKASGEENETGENNANSSSSNSLSFQLGRSIANTTKSRMHECSICGAEFSSGQALGGHMRRHRTAVADVGESRKERSIISLDLNLPAPEDDSHLSKSLVFASSPMVDCHY